MESVAGSVIQASGTVEFEDGLRTGVLLGGCWCPWGGCTYLNQFQTPLEVQVGPGGSVVVIGTLFSDQILVLSAHQWC